MWENVLTAVPVAPKPSVQYTGGGNWYDPNAYGGTGSLAGVNSLSGLQFHAATPETSRETESGTWVNPAEGAYVISSNGTKLYLSGDDQSGYTFTDNYNDPSGNSTHDQTRITYSYDPKTGTATPIGNQHYYQGSDWTNTYRDVLTYLGPVLAAGAGGAYLGAGSTAGEGAGAVSGMDLAADAAVGSGNNIVTAGGALSGGEAATGGLSGMDLAADAPVGAGNNITTAGGALGGTSTAAENAALRQLFQENPSLSSVLKQGGSALSNWITQNPGAAKALVGLIGSGASAIAGAGAAGDAEDAVKQALAGQLDAAGKTVSLGQQQLDWAKQQYADAGPMRDYVAAKAKQVSDAQTQNAADATAMSKDLYDYSKTTYRPLEQKIVADAQNYDTPGRRAEAMAAARSDVEQAYGSTSDALQRAVGRTGSSAASPRALSLMSDAAYAKANALAGATTAASRNVEETGHARQMDAVKLGQNLIPQATAAANTATTAGNSAVTNATTGLSAVNAGVPSMLSAFNGASGATASGGNLFGQAAGGNQKISDQYNQTLGSLGSALGAWAASPSGAQTISDIVGWLSDKNAKKNTGKPLDTKKALAGIEKTPVDEDWTYTDDPDETPHDGPMAQSVRKHMGDKVAPGGKVIDAASMNAHLMGGMQELAKRVSKLEQRKAA